MTQKMTVCQGWAVMGGEGTDSHRRHCFPSNNTTGGRGRCVLVFTILNTTTVFLYKAFGKSMKPTSVSRFLVLRQRWKWGEHPDQCNPIWLFWVTDKFSTKSLQTSSPLKLYYFGLSFFIC